jgi:glycosyltransferase involved in cell wall biosynthesis
MNRGMCLFTDSLHPSGVGEHLFDLAAELRRQYRIAFVCPPSRFGRPLLDRIRALGVETLPLEVRGEATARQRLAGWLQARRIEVFHGHAGSTWEGYEGIYAARAAGVRAVVRTEHLPDVLTDPVERRSYYRLQQLVDRIICVSEGVRATFRQASVPAHRLRVVRNGISPRRVTPDRAGVRAGLGLPPDTLMVLTVARFYPQKGHCYLAEAAPYIVERVPNAHFIWVGEGEHQDELCQQVQALGLAGHVSFLGSRDDVPELMAAADLFVLPSLFEGLPLVVLEAMAADLPVVGTRVCGTSELIEDSVTGRLVEARDAMALASALIQALTQPSLRARWARAAQRRWQEEGSAARMARETAAVYDELLGQTTTSPRLEQIVNPATRPREQRVAVGQPSLGGTAYSR